MNLIYSLWFLWALVLIPGITGCHAHSILCLAGSPLAMDTVSIVCSRHSLKMCSITCCSLYYVESKPTHMSTVHVQHFYL